MPNRRTNLLIAGRPGIGKTTLIKKLAHALARIYSETKSFENNI